LIKAGRTATAEAGASGTRLPAASDTEAIKSTIAGTAPFNAR
jgi:hypothetical protein